MRTRRSRITYASLLALVAAACGRVAFTAAPAELSDADAGDERSTSETAAGDEAVSDDGATSEAAPVDSGAPCILPEPDDPAWEAGTVDASCGVVDSNGCYPKVTGELACAMLHNEGLCTKTFRFCWACGFASNGCSFETADGSVEPSVLATCDELGATTRIVCSAGGRRPEGLRSRRSDHEDVVADWFTECAWLEAASVVAFERLADELRRFDAPTSLVTACVHAASEEADHARRMGALARAHGGASCDPVVAEERERTLCELALENIVEGCVKETYAAAVAIVQSERARDAGVRDAMRVIAPEEASHAALAHAIDEWVRTRLTDDECMKLDRARAAAIADLRREAAAPVPHRLGRGIGLPSAAERLRIVDGLAAMA